MLCVVTCNLHAAALSDDTASLVAVTINGAEYPLNRSVLEQIPYFQAMLSPQEIGNMYYNLDIAVSDQESMARLPKRNLLTKIIALAKEAPITLSIPQEQVRAFFVLYNLLFKMKSHDFTDGELIERIQNASTPETQLRYAANNFFSVDAIQRAFDHWEIEVLKQDLKPSEHGIIAQAFFSPARNMFEIILALIKAEQKEIRIACYSFNNKEVAKELQRALQRGVKVRIIVDASDNSDVREIPICTWQAPAQSSRYQPAKMHNKFYIFSENIFGKSILVTGSANCTLAAQTNNFENIIVSNNDALIGQFEERFGHLLQVSTCSPARAASSSPQPASPLSPLIASDAEHLLTLLNTLPQRSAKRATPSSGDIEDEPTGKAPRTD